jgi:hypothetical protein
MIRRTLSASLLAALSLAMPAFAEGITNGRQDRSLQLATLITIS